MIRRIICGYSSSAKVRAEPKGMYDRATFIKVAWCLLGTNFYCGAFWWCLFFPAVFVGNLVAQTELVKATTALENAVFVTMQWLASVKPSSGLLYTIAEELKSQVKKMGGFFQMLIQVRKRYHTLK